MKSIGVLAAGVVLLLGAGGAAGGEYDFDLPAEEEDQLEISGTLDAKWALLNSRTDSPLYDLQLSGVNGQEYLSQYRLDLYLDGEYRRDGLRVFMRTFSEYTRQEPVAPTFYELYGAVSPSPRWEISAGKRRHSWGKGYAVNPVGYVNADKDPEDPDLALAGLSSIAATYNRSLAGGRLQSLSLSTVVIIPEAGVGTKYEAAERVGVASRLYLLVSDVDVDLMFLRRQGEAARYGLGFATNVRPHLELHGEIDYRADERSSYVRNGDILSREGSGPTYLLGLRYLTSGGTTLIGEYYHHRAGMSQDEVEAYLEYVRDGTAIDAAATRAALSSHFDAKNLSTDYLYLKGTRPEPLGWLYTSLSAWAIANARDGSAVLFGQLAYNGITDLEVLIRPALFVGGSDTEYGSKPFDQRLEAWGRFYF